MKAKISPNTLLGSTILASFAVVFTAIVLRYSGLIELNFDKTGWRFKIDGRPAPALSETPKPNSNNVQP